MLALSQPVAIAGSGSIESSELPPLDGVEEGIEASGDAPAAGQPASQGEAQWLGVPVAEIERMSKDMSLPLGSPMLASLWRQLLKGGPVGDPAALAYRARALLDGGWAKDAAALLAKAPGGDLKLTILHARAALAESDGTGACPILKAVPAAEAIKLDAAYRTDFVSTAAFCAAATRDETQSALAADVLRESGIDRPVMLAVLEGLGSGGATDLGGAGVRDLAEIRALGLLRPVTVQDLGDKPAPALVALAAESPSDDPLARAEATELAVRAHLLPASVLAEAYAAIEIAPEVRQSPLAQEAEGTLKRAILYQAATKETAMLRKSRYIRALLDETTREGLGYPVAALLADPVTALPEVGEISWFSETAVEILIAAGRRPEAASWIRRDRELDTTGARAGLGHWLVLADLGGGAREGRAEAMTELERAAKAGLFTPDVLQRTVTVLDAIEYNVPIPVWEMAGSGAQSDAGDLPETGLLSELQAAVQANDRPRTVLLAVLALARGGPSGAHQLALGDALRALKRVGMEREARALAFEALHPLWPRRAGG